MEKARQDRGEDTAGVPGPADDLAPAERSVDLWRRSREGDGDALRELCERYLPRLTRWATGRLPRHSRSVLETNDLVQETLFQALRHLEDFEPRHAGALAAYLRTALRNNILQQYRKGRTRPEPETLESQRSPSPALSPLEEAIGAETLARYDEALAGLDPVDREAVVLRIELDCSYAEIAEALGAPSANAARMRVARALARLAPKLAC